MDVIRSIGSISVALCLAGCATEPPAFIAYGHHPLIERDHGVNVVVDTCVKYDDIGDIGDHFLGAESRLIATNLAKRVTEYLSSKEIFVASAMTPFVCGAMHNAQNLPQRFKPTTSGDVLLIKQPFDISNEFANDSQYVAALGAFATYITQKALASDGDSQAKNVFTTSDPYVITSEDFKAASRLLLLKNTKQNLLYIGITAVRESAAQSTLKTTAANIAAAILAGVAAGAQQQPTVITPQGQIVRPPTVVAYETSLPNEGVSAKQVTAGLVDLNTGELVWVKSIGAAQIFGPNVMNELLFDVAHKRSAKWNPPGVPPQTLMP